MVGGSYNKLISVLELVNFMFSHNFLMVLYNFQIFAYVSQVHKVVLPEGLVDHETLTLEQVILALSISLYVFEDFFL